MRRRALSAYATLFIRLATVPLFRELGREHVLALMMSSLAANLAATGLTDEQLILRGDPVAVRYLFQEPQANASTSGKCRIRTAPVCLADALYGVRLLHFVPGHSPPQKPSPSRHLCQDVRFSRL